MWIEPELGGEGMCARGQLSLVFEANHKKDVHIRDSSAQVGEPKV